MGNKSHGVLTLWIFALEEGEKDEISQNNLDSWKVTEGRHIGSNTHKSRGDLDGRPLWVA